MHASCLCKVTWKHSKIISVWATLFTPNSLVNSSQASVGEPWWQLGLPFCIMNSHSCSAPSLHCLRSQILRKERTSEWLSWMSLQLPEYTVVIPHPVLGHVPPILRPAWCLLEVLWCCGLASDLGQEPTPGGPFIHLSSISSRNGWRKKAPAFKAGSNSACSMFCFWNKKNMVTEKKRSHGTGRCWAPVLTTC